MEITEEMIAAAERQSKQNGKGLLPMQPFTREVWIENISAIFNAMLSAAPTPPEVEPVYQLKATNGFWKDITEGQYNTWYTPYKYRKLYTSPPSPADDELRKAAQALVEWGDRNFLSTYIPVENLRAALKGKS